MDEINLKNFPQDIATTSNVTKDTKVLIANGVNTHVTTLSAISKLLGVNSEKVESVSPGELPYLDTKNNRYMEVTETGDYYFEGVLLANNPRGYITIFWWDGDSWSLQSQYRVMGDKGDTGDTGLSAYEQAVLEGFEGTFQEWVDQIADSSQSVNYLISEINSAKIGKVNLWKDENKPYPEGAIVLLEDGTEVISTIDNNISDPNVNMTGWELKQVKGIYFISAKEWGLTQWDDVYKNPPYTTQEYEQAYKNGVGIANAIKHANEGDYTEVVLERGKYPLLYPNLSGVIDITRSLLTGGIALDEIIGMTINFNSSVLFSLFDSVTKNPYNLSPSTQPAYEQIGCLISIQNSRGVIFKNGTLIGDQYKRSWVSGENQTEQTYGIKCNFNNRDFRFEGIKFTGFRGDGIQGYARGNPDLTIIASALQTWTAGDISRINGSIVEKQGYYHSVKISLVDKTIIDNRVQLMTLAARKIAFRCNDIIVIMYDENDNVLGYTFTEQAKDIHLFKNTTAIQFVVYDDERTTPTVTYNSLSFGIQLQTGMSYGFYVDKDCEFYENHRGGISNLGCGLVVDGAYFHDQGVFSKLGFPAYSFTTQYAINLEDTYINDLTVLSVVIDSVPIGVIANTKHFTMRDCNIKNTRWSGVSIFGSCFTHIESNTIQDSGRDEGGIPRYTAIEYKYSTNDLMPSHHVIKGNILNNASLTWFGWDTNPLSTTIISDNTIIRGRYEVSSTSGTLISKDNTIIEVWGSGTTLRGYSVLGAKYAGDTLSGIPFDQKSVSTAEVYASRECLDGGGTYDIYNSMNLTRSSSLYTKSTGGVFKGKTAGARLRTVYSSVSDDLLYSREITAMEFNNLKLTIADSGSSTTIGNTMTVIDNCYFKNASNIDLFVRNTRSGTKQTIVVRNTTFDLTTSTVVFNNSYAQSNAVELVFINCNFISDIAKSISFIQGSTINITATANNCKFINVTNTSSVLQISGTSKVVYDPPSIDASNSTTTSVTLLGAKVGDLVQASFDKYDANVEMSAVVSAANTVTVRFKNIGTTPVDLASGTLTVKLV